MKVMIGMNATLVLLPARAKRNVVAADTGDAKFSYSSDVIDLLVTSYQEMHK